VKNIVLLYINSVSQFHVCKNVHFHFYGLNSSCSCHPSTMPDHISGVLFYGLVVHPGSKLCHLFLSLAVFFDDCHCFQHHHHQVLEGHWPDHAATTTLYIISASICLYHHPCLYLLVLFLFLLCFSRSSLFLLSGYNSVWPGCTMCIVIVWFFRIASETWSSNYFGINIRTGNIVIVVVNVRYIIVRYFTGIICRALSALFLLWYCVIFQ